MVSDFFQQSKPAVNWLRSLRKVRDRYEGSPGWLKAPNGHPTALTEAQWLLVRTPKFKAWFGDWEHCECGVLARRDPYSAFLAMHVAGEHLDSRQARKAWPGAEPLLDHAVSRCNQTAKGEARLTSFGLHKLRRQSCSHGKEGLISNDAGDVVPCMCHDPETNPASADCMGELWRVRNGTADAVLLP